MVRLSGSIRQGEEAAPALRVEVEGDTVATNRSGGAGADRKEVVKEWAAEFKLDD